MFKIAEVDIYINIYIYLELCKLSVHCENLTIDKSISALNTFTDMYLNTKY